VIGQLRGKLLHKQAPFLLIDVQGVGYEVEAPMTTIYKLPAVGEEVHLHTHLAIRDDAHLLFGFISAAERRLFRTLLKVNGVGAKMALAILSSIEVQEFTLCVQQGNAERLVKLPGIGKKTAERLIMEMRDRLTGWDLDGVATDTSNAAPAEADNAITEAESALIALGYKPQTASRYVHGVASEGMNAEEIIRAALQAIGK